MNHLTRIYTNWRTRLVMRRATGYRQWGMRDYQWEAIFTPLPLYTRSALRRIKKMIARGDFDARQHAAKLRACYLHTGTEKRK